MGYSRINLGTIFSYITNMSLANYIRRRKLTLAYYDIKNENGSIADIAMKWGYSDQPSFTKAYKKMMGVSPSKIVQLDVGRLQEPLNVDDLLTEEVLEKVNKIQLQEKEKVFGIDINVYNELLKIREFCADYDISEENAKIAYDFSKYLNIDIEDALVFIDEYIIHFGSEVNIEQNNQLSFYNTVIRKDVYKMCFEHNYLCEDAKNFLEITEKYNIDPFSICDLVECILYEWDLKLNYAIFIADCLNYCEIEINYDKENRCFGEDNFELDFIMSNLFDMNIWSYDYDKFRKVAIKIIKEVDRVANYEEPDYYSMSLQDDYYDFDEFIDIKSNQEDYYDIPENEYDSLLYGYGDLEDNYDE